MHRIDASCHWCGDVPAPWRLSGALLRNAAAVALMVVGAGAVWRVAPAVRDFASTRQTRNDVTAAPTTTYANTAPTASDANARYAADSARVAAAVSQTLDSAAAVVLAAGDDSVRWTPAVARTWVNVRSDASRTGEVVGVIQPAARAMLGTDRAGWRQVRSPDVSGWVDPRLFEADSLRTRGN
ncbi:MAG: SH3 domain-containing protein [Gemmatimonadetes bacterium]|nr:SH3 domain-containing protein [Gemmatimonadota bacterium]